MKNAQCNVVYCGCVYKISALSRFPRPALWLSEIV